MLGVNVVKDTVSDGLRESVCKTEFLINHDSLTNYRANIYKLKLKPNFLYLKITRP